MLKKYIFERLQDVEATKLAETVFNEIVFHKQKEVQEKFKNWGIIDFNTPDGIKLDSFEGVFSLKIRNKLASSFYSPSKNDKLIVLSVVGYDKYSDMLDNLIRIIMDKKSTFIHEFIHMLDDIRSDGKILKDPENRESGQKSYEKLNREVNARFHQIASAVKEKYIDKEIASIKKDYFLNRKKFENEFDFEGLSEKEKLNLVLVNSSEYICNIGYLVDLFKEEIFNFFHYELEPDLEKRLLSRAYTYFSELIKSYDIDCSKKIKTIYENKMGRNKINSLLETYRAITEDDLNEVIYVPNEGSDEEGNEYWIKQMKLSIDRLRAQNPLNGVKYDLDSIDFPNEIINLYGKVFAIVLYSNENMEDIVYMTRYELYRDGIKLINTRSVPNVRGRGLALRIYKALKQKLNTPIYSDTSHSPFTKFGVWKKLYKESPNSVKAYDVNKDQKFDIEMRLDRKGEEDMFYIDNNVDIKEYKKTAKTLGINWDKDWNKGSQINWDNIPADVKDKLTEYSKYKEVYSKKDNGIILVYL